MEVNEAIQTITKELELTDVSVPDIVNQLDDNASLRQFCLEVAGGVGRLAERCLGLERQSTEQRLRLVNLEQSLKNLQRKRGEESQELDKLRQELETSQHRITTFEKQGAGKDEQQLALEEEARRLREELEMTQAKNERLESERTELLRSLERRQVEIDRLNEQNETFLSKMRELREEVLRKDGLVGELQGKLLSTQLQLRFSQEEAAKQGQLVEWHTQELDRTREEFGSFRKDKSAELGEAQAQVQGLTARTSQLEEQVARLRARGEQRDRQVEEALEKAKEAESKLAEREALFIQELEVKGRLAEVYKGALEETTARLETAEQMLTAQQHVDERIKELETRHTQQLDELRAELVGREREIEVLRRHLDELGGSLEGVEDNDITEATASVAYKKSNVTFSQVYSEYARTKTALLRSEQEVGRLKDCLANICQDIEARVPALQAERKELERLKGDCQTLGEQLMVVSKSRDALEMRLREAQDQLRQKPLLEQQVADLGAQVQHLLRTMESSGSVPDVGGRLGEGDGDGIVDADQVISERLVVFRNIQELQVRNQELVRVVRELSSQQEMSEIERLRTADNEMRAKLGEMSRELDELRETRQKQTALVESLVRQRDMLRDLAAGKDSQKVDNIQSSIVKEGSSTILPYGAIAMEEFELFKREKENIETRLAKQLDEARELLTTAKSNAAQLKAQCDFGQERYELLRRNYDMERTELDTLRKSNHDALTSIMNHQAQVQRLMSDLVESKDREARWQGDLGRLRTELEVTQAAERRHQEEIATLEREKERLTTILVGLQSLNKESEAQDTSLKEGLMRQVDGLERELQSCRLRLAEEVESSRLAAARTDREYRDLVRRYDQLMETFNRSKEELAQSRLTLHEHQRKAADLESLLARQEARLEQLMRPALPGDSSVTSTSAFPADLPRELAAVRAKIGSLEDELGLEKEHTIRYQEMARTAESNLLELNRTCDEYRSMMERTLAQVQEQKAESDEERDRLRADLAQAAETIEGLRQDMRAMDSQHRDKVQRLQHQLDELREYESMAKTHSSMRKEDVERLQKLLERTREQYEAEVIGRGQDVEALKSVRDQVTQLEERLKVTNEQLRQAQMMISGHDEALQRERENLMGERLDLEKRLAELETQNNILLGRLEQQKGPRDITPASGTDGELAKVVAYLRRQKDVLQVEHDALAIDYRRVKTQAEQLQRSLDEHRSWLEEERRANQWQAQMATEYTTLLEKLEQLKMVRESNVTLRAESETLDRRARELEERLEEIQQRTGPLEEERLKLLARVDVLGEEARAIAADRDHWRSRYNNLLNQLSKVEDEGELGRLRQELDTVKDQLKNSAEKEKELIAAQETVEYANERFTQLEQKYKALTLQSRQIARTRDDYAKRIAELEQQLSSGKVFDEQQEGVLVERVKVLTIERDKLADQVKSSQDELQEQREKVNRLSEAIKKVAKIREQFKTLQDQYRTAQTALEASELRAAKVKQEADMRYSLLQSKVNKLKAEIEELRRRLGEPIDTSTVVVTSPDEDFSNIKVGEKRRQKSLSATLPTPKVTVLDENDDEEGAEGEEGGIDEEEGQVQFAVTKSPIVKIIGEPERGGAEHERETERAEAEEEEEEEAEEEDEELEKDEEQEIESEAQATALHEGEPEAQAETSHPIIMMDDDEEDEAMMGFSDLEEGSEQGGVEEEVGSSEPMMAATGGIDEHEEGEEHLEKGIAKPTISPTAKTATATTTPSTITGLAPTSTMTSTTLSKGSRVIDLSGIGRGHPSRTAPLIPPSTSTLTGTMSGKGRGPRGGRGGPIRRPRRGGGPNQ